MNDGDDDDGKIYDGLWTRERKSTPYDISDTNRLT